MVRDHHVEERAVEGLGSAQGGRVHVRAHLVRGHAEAALGDACVREPLIEASQLLDLGVLSGGDLLRQLLDLGALAVALRELGHVDRRLVVGDHLRHESAVDAVPGHLRRLRRGVLGCLGSARAFLAARGERQRHHRRAEQLAC